MNSSMKIGTIDRSSIKERILRILSQASHPISTDEIATQLHISWHTAIRHCLDLELEGRVTKFIIGRISAWRIKK